MHTQELKSDQPGVDRRSVSHPVSSLTITNVLAPLSEKKKENPNKKTPSFLFWFFLLSIKLKTPSTCYPEQLHEAPLFDTTLSFRKTHDRIPDGEVLGCTLSSPEVSESAPPEMHHSLSWATGETLDGCRTVWPYDNKSLWMETSGSCFWEANINEEGPFRNDMNWIKCPPF